jgi:Fic family protein
MYTPRYRITPYLLNLIDEASALRAWIGLAPLKVSWLPIMQKEARAKGAHFSTSIEGNTLSLDEVRALERGEKVGKAQEQEVEVANYLKAMQWIERERETRLEEKEVCQLHKVLTRDLLAEEKCGVYKQKQNYILDENGIRTYTPPSPQATPKLMEDLLTWLNERETRQLHSVLVCAILHHRLVSIHPFADGNGRLARALGTFILYQREYDLHHIFSLDEFFAGNRRRYYQKIDQARELDDNLTYWMEYVAEGVVATLKNVKERIEALQVTAAGEMVLTPRQEEALRILRDSPSLRVAEFTKRLKVTRARMHQILTPLVKSGLVLKEGESRATAYRLNLR